MVYVLELSKPLGHSRYYIGWSKNPTTLGRRIEHHKQGRGSAFTRAAIKAGIELTPVVILNGEKDLERRLKNWKSGKRVVQRYFNSKENLINK